MAITSKYALLAITMIAAVIITISTVSVSRAVSHEGSFITQDWGHGGGGHRGHGGHHGGW